MSAPRDADRDRLLTICDELRDLLARAGEQFWSDKVAATRDALAGSGGAAPEVRRELRAGLFGGMGALDDYTLERADKPTRQRFGRLVGDLRAGLSR